MFAAACNIRGGGFVGGEGGGGGGVSPNAISRGGGHGRGRGRGARGVKEATSPIKAQTQTHLGTGDWAIVSDPHSPRGPSTSAYSSSRCTSRRSHLAPRCTSVSMRSTMLDD